MKTIIVVLSVLCITLNGITQNELPKTMANIDEVEVSPPLFLGMQKMSVETEASELALFQRYLIDNIDFKEEESFCFKEGTEVVQFAITPQGTLSDIKIISSVCPLIDKKVIRVLETTNGMWQAGTNNTVPVQMEKEVSLLFSYSDYDSCEACLEYFTKTATYYFVKGSKKLYMKDKPKRALHCFNDAMRYRPNDESLLFARGLCSFKLGNIEEAKKDWNRIVTLGGDLPLEIADYDMSQMDGYSDMLKIFAQIEN